MQLTILKNIFSIYRLPSNTECPKGVFKSEFYSVTKTDDELSIVCDEKIRIADSKEDKNWRCIKVVGPLDFSLVGILAKISNTLSSAQISIFAISTFDTDYILIKNENLEKAKSALENNGYTFV